jgi:hypothetical protein
MDSLTPDADEAASNENVNDFNNIRKYSKPERPVKSKGQENMYGSRKAVQQIDFEELHRRPTPSIVYKTHHQSRNISQQTVTNFQLKICKARKQLKEWLRGSVHFSLFQLYASSF